MQGKGEPRLGNLQLLGVDSLCFGVHMCVCVSVLIEGKALLFGYFSVCVCLCVCVC